MLQIDDCHYMLQTQVDLNLKLTVVLINANGHADSQRNQLLGFELVPGRQGAKLTQDFLSGCQTLIFLGPKADV